jgi:hypothetical protein
VIGVELPEAGINDKEMLIAPKVGNLMICVSERAMLKGDALG